MPNYGTSERTIVENMRFFQSPRADEADELTYLSAPAEEVAAQPEGDDEEAGDEQQQQQQTQSVAEENGGMPTETTAHNNSSDNDGRGSPSGCPTIGNINKAAGRSRSRSRSRCRSTSRSRSGSDHATAGVADEVSMNGEAAEGSDESPARPATTPSPVDDSLRQTSDGNGEEARTTATVPGSPATGLREIKLEPDVDREESTEAEERVAVRPPSSSSGSSLGQTPSPTPLPILRLNVALASDPAANPDAKDLKNIGATDAAFEEKQSQHQQARLHHQQQQQHVLSLSIGHGHATLQQAVSPSVPPTALLASRKPSAAVTLKGPELALPLDLPPRLPMFICEPCGIRFSSASTLEAHQTYYCSHRKDADEGGGGGGSGGAGGGSTGSVTPVASGGSAGSATGGKNAHPGGGDGSGEPPAKAAKTGKQYACSQCSYSADKKVSLNRHMRMHQSSPTPSPVGGALVNGDEVAGHHHHHHQQQQQQQQQLQLIQAQAVAAAAAVLHQQQQPPASSQQAAVVQVDRYCSDCDIRFSSTKTYRAHKQHYCSSRHREGNQSNNSTPKPVAAQKSGSQSPPDVPKTPPVSTSQQPFLALPTNPIIVIPYSLIRGASVIPGLLSSLAPGIANPDSACFIFQNGALQPIAMSLASHVQAVTMATTTGPSGLEVLGGPGQQQQQQQLLVGSRSSSSNNQLQAQQQQQQQQSRGPTPNVSNENSSHSIAGGGGGGVSSSTGEVLKAINKRDNTANKESTGSTPLDLSVRRLSPAALGSLSLRERSLSLSSAVSLDQRLDFDSLMEGKENLSLSGDSLTPEQIVCAPSLPGSPPLTPSPKRRSNSPRGTGPGSSNASAAAAVIAAAAAAGQHAALGGGALSLSPLTLQQQLMRPLLPADIALRLSAVSDPGVNLNLNILPNSHTLLTKQSVELALRLSSSSSSSSSAAAVAAGAPPTGNPTGGLEALPKPQMSPLLHSISPNGATPSNANAGSGTVLSGPTPQIFVKQGDSKCKECNIVFCKYENYLAHKKHYCSARNQADGEHTKISPPISPQSLGSSSAATAVVVNTGGTMASSGGPGARNSVGLVGGPAAYQQLICANCGIKFTSLDNLTAHQMYYCPKRMDASMPVNTISTSVSAPTPHKERCSKCKSMHEPGQPCTVAGHGAYKCPICEAISPNSTEARRHMDTHGGVKAFRCTICRYKGNTLRGMRTHIRMHFDKKTNEFNEENYITCILEEDGIEIPPAGAQNAAALAAAAAAMAPQKFLGQEPHTTVHESGPGSRNSPPSLAGNGAQSGAVQVARHHCEFCPYSSSNRINVAQHIKHVHGRERPSSGGSPLIGEGGESLLYDGGGGGPMEAPAGTILRPAVASTPGLSTGNSHIKTEPEDEPSVAGENDEQDTSDINVDVVMEEAPTESMVIKTETVDPHMPSLNSPPITSPTSSSPLPPPPPPQATSSTNSTSTAAASLNLKPKSHPVTVQSARSSPSTVTLKTPSPPAIEPKMTNLPPGPKYCDTCNITFNYTNTYIAHKKFYCKAATAGVTVGPGVPGTVGGSRSASASPSGRSTTGGGATSPAVAVAVNRAAETSV